MRIRNVLIFAILGSAPFTPQALSQQQGNQGPAGLPQGVTREQMWPAASAEEWKRPCLIHWQRTWEDAVAVAKESKKLILVCVNMDGEIASEHYAGIRYRQPEIAKLYEPYVCVIASVYRHSPRDFDEQGRRVLCPRFGTVTCGEHIAIEPILFEKFLEGRRIAPRHIAVDIENGEKKNYDVFYTWDTDTVFNTVRDGVLGRPVGPVAVRSDRPIAERVASRDDADRAAVEKAYAEGNAESRRALLEAALANPNAEQLGLLRQALFGFDPDLAKVARKTLTLSTSANSVDLIVESLRVPMDAQEKSSLISTLERLGESSPRARLAATIQHGLGGQKGSIDAETWAKLASETRGKTPPTPSELSAQLDAQEYAAAAQPADPKSFLDLAESNLELALEKMDQPNAKRKITALYFQDALNAAAQAERLGGSGWRLDATTAVASWYLGNGDEAEARAERAAKSIPTDPQGRVTAAVLDLFARARRKQVEKAIREKKEWPAQWLADVNSAYSLLAKHPLGSEFHAANHYDFILWLGGAAQAGRILEAGLKRFPDAPSLHTRWRQRILHEQGIEGLEPAYEKKLAEKQASAGLDWFAGYASILVAEGKRRGAENDKALAAYERAIGHFERYIEKNPATRANADHYVAMAFAGRGRIALDAKRLEEAVAQTVASFERMPEVAATADGLNVTAVDTAKMLLARLKEAKQDGLAATLQSALDKLDPELLRLPAYERELPPEGAPAERTPRRSGQ